jgi:nucleoside-diphosphate-sugar epimerase
LHFLVIGGTRFMGVALVDRLLAEGDRVTVLSRGKLQPAWWNRVDHITADRTNREEFARQLKGRQFDGAIDMVAFERPDVESADEVLAGNVGRYLFVSSTSVYQNTGIDYRRDCPIPESAGDWSNLDYSLPALPPGESDYAAKKRHCEKWLIENARTDYTIIRLTSVMGCFEDRSKRLWWWVQRLLDNGPMLMPMEDRACFRTIFLEDVAPNLIRAIKSPATVRGVYHLTAPEILDDVTWTEAIWTALGKTCDRVYVPWEVIRRREALKGFGPAMTRSTPNIPDIFRGQRDFGLSTMPFAQRVAAAAQWYAHSYTGVPDRPFDSSGYENRAAEIELARQWRERFVHLVAEV